MKRQSSSDSDDVSRVEEDGLMQEFALLSARLEADEISTEEFSEQRDRIFGEAGLETH